ncbi:MAG TPA: hypothetical protein VFG32_06270 [Bacteroidota bacterium]|nr:hypothetical protein [Bacteroidota bacterium]
MGSLRSRPVLLSVGLYAVASLISTQVPLLNYLGFEFSFLIGLLGSLIAGFLTISLVRPLLSGPDLEPDARVAIGRNAFLIAAKINLTLLIIPLAVMLTNALFVKNCSVAEGAGFFLLIPTVSVLFAGAIAFFCAAHYRFPRMMFILFMLATFAYTLGLGYYTPAIFSYNFFYGYFPGLTYDESLGIPRALVWFRFFTLFAGGVVLWMTFLLLRSVKFAAPTTAKGIALVRVLVSPEVRSRSAAVCVVLVGVYLFRAQLGFESPAGYIQGQLGSSFTTEHFTIYYSGESYSGDEIKWIGAEHEFRLMQLCDALHLPFHGRVESYIYPSAEVKQRLMGVGNTNIAKPWSNQIHIAKHSLDGTLKHELVHVLAAPFGMPVIHASLSTGLVEGLAMAIEWDWGNRTLHQYAAGMRKFGVAPDISWLMTITGFAAQSSSVSYVVAGSFCRFLIDRYGIRRMMQLYRNGEYDLIYGRSLGDLITEWQGFLDRIPVTDGDRDAIDVLFRRPAIFQKVCARVIAARNAEAREKFIGKDYTTAARLYGQSYDDGRGYDALSGYLASALHAREFAVLTTALDTIIMKDPNPAQYLPLLVNIGLARWGEGNYTSALDLFHRVACAEITEPLTEAALVCSTAVKDTINRDALFRYYLSSASDTLRISTLDSMVVDSIHWLPLYHKGRVLTRLHRWDDAIRVLRQLAPGIGVPQIEALRWKTMGYGMFRLKRFEEAKSLYWTSLNFIATDVARNEVNEWVERCEWMGKYLLP